MHAVMWPILKLFGITCESAFELSAAQLDRKLSMSEAMRLRVHLLMCGLCRGIPSQFRRMQELVRCAEQHEDCEDGELLLPLETKDRIAELLRKEDASGI